MVRNDEEMAWYNQLPIEKRQLLDLWADNDLNWISGELWLDKPHSVELEMYTDAGGDMIIDLEDITVESLEEYVNDFNINEEVSSWWRNGEPGNGVPFDNQGEHVEDLEAWLSELRDIIDLSRGKENEYTNEQQRVMRKLENTKKELEKLGISFTYSHGKGFEYSRIE